MLSMLRKRKHSYLHEVNRLFLRSAREWSEAGRKLSVSLETSGIRILQRRKGRWLSDLQF